MSRVGSRLIQAAQEAAAMARREPVLGAAIRGAPAHVVQAELSPGSSAPPPPEATLVRDADGDRR